MPLTKRHLAVFRGDPLDAREQAPRPTPGQVLYAPPNPDRSRKMCQNCMLWHASDQQCVVHTRDFIAAPSGVCGYHLFGRPDGNSGYGGAFGDLSADQTGYVETQAGTSCDLCVNYVLGPAGQGTCRAVRELDGDMDAVVAALGCCTLWESQ